MKLDKNSWKTAKKRSKEKSTLCYLFVRNRLNKEWESIEKVTWLNHKDISNMDVDGLCHNINYYIGLVVLKLLGSLVVYVDIDVGLVRYHFMLVSFYFCIIINILMCSIWRYKIRKFLPCSTTTNLTIR